MNPEKYISIEYSVWNTKYKPMEEKVKQLQEELEEERNNKMLTLNINFSRYMIHMGGPYFHPNIRCIGSVDFDLEGVPKLNLKDRESISSIISKEYFAGMRSYNDKFRFASEEMVTNALSKIGQDKQEVAILISQNEERIKNIPKIIKWLFKIK
jgi:hypothetical protein